MPPKGSKKARGGSQAVSTSTLLATPRREMQPHPSRLAAGGPPARYATRSAPWLSAVPSRILAMYAPEAEPTAPIRLPGADEPASEAAAAADDQPAAAPAAEAGSPPEAAAAAPTPGSGPAPTPGSGPIKLRDGWGYKIGETRFRAVFDPARKSIPKLPLRGPGGYSVVPVPAHGAGDGSEDKKPSICLYVNSFQEPEPEPEPVPAPAPEPAPVIPRRSGITYRRTPVPRSAPRATLSRKRPQTSSAYYQTIDHDASLAVKRCFDERLAEEPSSPFAALIRIDTEEEMALPDEHVYTRPRVSHTAEIVTTFPLEETTHYRNKKYKDDHVVIDSADLEVIYHEVHRVRNNRRRWARVKARCAVDEEYAEKQRQKKIRGYAAEKAKIAAMSKEERRAINVRKHEYHKARRAAENPDEALAREQRLEERRAINVERAKELLAAGVEDPEERRRLQRRIRKSEMTPEARREWMLRDIEYQRRKKEKLANATPEELAAIEEEKRLKAEKRAALALLTPKERMRVQQREYEANYKARKLARGEPLRPRRATVSPSKKRQGASKRKVDRRAEMKREEMDEDSEVEVEEEVIVDVLGDDDDEHDHHGIKYFDEDGFSYVDGGDVCYEEENEMAVKAIASPSPPAQPPRQHRYSRLAPGHHPAASFPQQRASYHHYAPPRHQQWKMEEDDDEEHDDYDDGMEMDSGPSSSHHRHHHQLQLAQQHRQHLQYQQQQQQPRYGGYIEMAGPSRQSLFDGDLEAELLQLQKDVAWSDKAIHNSRAEAERLRAEAASLERAVEEELQAQVERKRRIARLTAIWREDHGEDSQG